jgi:hypothetical protein
VGAVPSVDEDAGGVGVVPSAGEDVGGVGAVPSVWGDAGEVFVVSSDIRMGLKNKFFSIIVRNQIFAKILVYFYPILPSISISMI